MRYVEVMRTVYYRLILGYVMGFGLGKYVIH